MGKDQDFLHGIPWDLAHAFPGIDHSGDSSVDVQPRPRNEQATEAPAVESFDKEG